MHIAYRICTDVRDHINGLRCRQCLRFHVNLQPVSQDFQVRGTLLNFEGPTRSCEGFIQARYELLSAL